MHDRSEERFVYAAGVYLTCEPIAGYQKQEGSTHDKLILHGVQRIAAFITDIIIK